jgi:integrase
MGYLFQRKKNGKVLETWWAKYYVNGRPVRESTGTASKKMAQRILDDRAGRVARGEALLPRADKVRWQEAAQDLREHYTATGSRETEEAEARLKHLDAFFEGYKLAMIGPAEVTRYVARRQAEATRMIAARDGETITRRLTSNATVNRELGVLGRLLKLAYENGKLARMPLLRKLKESSPRQGFFEPPVYEAVRKQLAPDLQVACAIMYTFGWRKSEVLSLERRQLDLAAGTLRLDLGTTKNGDGRIVYLTGDLKMLLAAQVERVKTLERQLERIVPFLFPHLKGRHRGTRIRDFRKAWATACRNAGVPGMLRHDFRRTAVRNLERRGVPRSVATKLTGHKTEAVYRRYAIVSDADLREAALRLDGVDAPRGHTLGHTASTAVDSRSLSR